MISVDDLTTLPTLGLEIVAGHGGGRRMVTWAHVCDLDDPWNWVGEGDLVMTTGPGVPHEPSEQVDWVSKIIDAGISALVLAPGPNSPQISEDLLAVAGQRDFPVLTGKFDLHFVSLARAVIESSIEAERRRIAAITRLYESNGLAVESGADLTQRLSSLEKNSGWTLCLWDVRDGTVLVAGRRAMASGLAGEPGRAEQIEKLSGDPHLRLSAERLHGPASDRPLLAHVVGLLTMEYSYRAAHQDRQRQSGQELFIGLLDETITPAAVWPELTRRGLSDTVAIACWQSGAGAALSHESLHRQVWLGDLAPPLLPQGEQLLGIIPDDEVTAVRIAEALGRDVVTGVSAPITSNSSFPEVVRQARLTLSRALETGETCVKYGESWQDQAMFPATLIGVRNLVRTVLGPVVDYDRENSTELIASLWVFLDNDGNWSRSAEQLHIHRQTLVYRMNKVSELASLAPASSRGTALMWFALESARRAGIDITEITVT